MLTTRNEPGHKRAQQDSRRTRRLALSFQIKVSGVDRSGKFFSDLTVTSNVSGNGCSFDLLREVRQTDVVAIQVAQRNAADEPIESRPLLFEVVWVRPNEHGWAVGASKLDAGYIWPITFPHAREAAEPKR